MRVIAGRLGGRRLRSFSADHIRPTTDRIKGSIFNKLMHLIEGARVLDLFSGTGNLSIESVSRGACQVVAVESSKKSLELIKANLKDLGIEREVSVVSKDVFNFLKAYGGEPFSIILIDPPFTEKIAHKVMAALAESAVWDKGSVVVIEAAAREQLDEVYGSLHCFDLRNYGDKKVGFFSCKQNPSPLEA